MKAKQKNIESRAAARPEQDAQKLLNEEFKDEDAPKVVEMGDAPKPKKKFDKPFERKPIVRAPQDEPAPEAK